VAGFLNRMERHLGLSAEQMRQIEQILAQSHAESEAIRAEVLPRVRGQMERTHQRLLDVLTPEQREKFEKLRRRHHGWTERFLLGHGHGPPRPGYGPPPKPPPEP
jgi:hypothetical protein